MHNDDEAFAEKLDIKIWMRLFRFVKPYKRKAIGLFVYMVLSGAIDSVLPMLQMYAVDNFITRNSTEGLVLFGIAMAVVIVLQVFSTYFLVWYANSLSMSVCYDLRRVGFVHLQRLSFSYYDKTQVGWIVARMTSDTYSLAGVMTWALFDFVWAASVVLFVTVFMLILNWKLALIMLSVMPVLAISAAYFQKRILRHQREVRKYNSRITGGFNEGIMGARTSKVLGTEKENLGEFRQITEKMFNSSVKTAIFSSLFLPVVMTLGSIGTALMLSLGGSGLAVGGGSFIGVISFGALSAFLTFSIQIFEPLREVARAVSNVISTQASAERVITLLDSEIEVKDSDDVIKVYGSEEAPKRENWPGIKGDITFRNVTFSYGGGKNVLENFSLDIKQGETIAFVGETGAGKSTIVNLVCRFYEPIEGQILIDGVDYRERSQLWLQSNLGYVLQDPHLFSGSIKENIRYGKLEATDEEIENAAKAVKIHNYIVSLPKGYDTEVEEGGSRLSTGQKQLISIARAVLADPRIFVLDEATSSVDTETEKLIQDAIQYVMKDRTSFVIAHRLSTIQQASRIFVIKDGSIHEQGEHRELLKKKGYYYRLYTNQFLKESGLL
ncbi:MAG: ABC transporter ATP-binding protein/permease [Oscillospiraceae bacterium]|nr:ABC transporter ATP-binding protein/permease [Oscillospiraceae bacterium]